MLSFSKLFHGVKRKQNVAVLRTAANRSAATTSSSAIALPLSGPPHSSNHNAIANTLDEFLSDYEIQQEEAEIAQRLQSVEAAIVATEAMLRSADTSLAQVREQRMGDAELMSLMTSRGTRDGDVRLEGTQKCQRVSPMLSGDQRDVKAKGFAPSTSSSSESGNRSVSFEDPLGLILSRQFTTSVTEMVALLRPGFTESVDHCEYASRNLEKKKTKNRKSNNSNKNREQSSPIFDSDLKAVAIWACSRNHRTLMDLKRTLNNGPSLYATHAIGPSVYEPAGEPQGSEVEEERTTTGLKKSSSSQSYHKWFAQQLHHLRLKVIDSPEACDRQLRRRAALRRAAAKKKSATSDHTQLWAEHLRGEGGAHMHIDKDTDRGAADNVTNSASVPSCDGSNASVAAAKLVTSMRRLGLHRRQHH